MDTSNTYENANLQRINIADVTVGYRQIGSGKDLVFIHGFPTHGYTWRKILPRLSAHFKCHILDLPGLGESDWSKDTKFDTRSQAGYTTELLKKLGVNRYSVIAHNSGATVARYMAVAEKENIENLIIIDTEIPNHRPDWIPMFQKIGLIPPLPFIFMHLLKQQWFIESPLGFQAFYADRSLLKDKANIQPYTNAATKSYRKMIALLKYLRGIDWQIIDDFEHLHGEIRARPLLIWGEKDQIFPIETARKMVPQFKGNAEFVTIKGAALMPHEEKPDEVVNAILNFI